VLTRNGFGHLVMIYPDLDAAIAAAAGRHEQETADPAARTGELLDVAVASIFDAGLTLQAAVDLSPDVAVQRITETLRRLDDVVRETRDHVLAGRGERVEPGLAWRPPPHVLERWGEARYRSELLQRHMARTAQAVQSAAADTAALLERRADLVGQPGRIDYPTEIKKWRALADQASQIAERWKQQP
jgi:hypothetical protein